MIVRVAIDLALDRLFTYLVPEALKGKLVVGQLLSVPFCHREARGFAMAIAEADTGQSHDAAKKYALKPVTGILDETPFFSARLLDLVKGVAMYTAAPIETVLKAALPAAVLKKNVKARELMFIEPAFAPVAVDLTKHQQWLYDQIARLGGGWMSQLCKELKTTPQSIKALGMRGLVKVSVRARRRDPLAGSRILASRPLPLNAEQQTALAAIDGEKPLLIFGVTGSGKTEVYLQAIAHELESDRGAIVMVPEISLTPQMVRRFASRFGNRVAVLHSALSDGERYDEWHRIRSGEAMVVVGPRSAVWAPVSRLGLIVVDEEHETSYKQDETPRYNARDVAVLRGRIEGAKVVLGSATPSLESWANARKGKYRLVTIARRAGHGKMPTVQLVDMDQERIGGAIFSSALLEAIRLRLNRAEQSILFLNRRGYSRAMVCSACGYVVECPQCSGNDRGMPYTYHRADNCLRCHVCGGWMALPTMCPKCKANAFSYKGIGTQRAEAALRKCFPNASILRMDADSTSRKNSHDDILGAFGRHEADILIGTQMIAKGLDFPNVTLVGVLNADSSLQMPDFRAAERTFQLLAQVSGRAGRAELPGEVLIQTRDVSEPTMKMAMRADYLGFAARELQIRKESFFPPFCHLAVVNVKGKDLKQVGEWAAMYAASIRRYAQKVVSDSAQSGGELRFEVSDAMSSAIEKADGWYRWLVVLRSNAASSIVKAWRWISDARPAAKTLRVTIDIDAVNIL